MSIPTTLRSPSRPLLMPRTAARRFCAASALFGFATVCLAGCAGPRSEPEIAPELSAFTERGDYAVGYSKRTIRYDNYITSGLRDIDVNIWYPAESPSEVPAVYGVAIIQLETPAATQDPAASTEGPFPLVVYSHGSGGDGMLGYPYGELLASHGYVVVAPSHVGNTTVETIKRATLPFTTLFAQRPADVRATIDYFENKKPIDNIAAITNTTRILLFGHSFGGFTTFANVAGPLSLETMREENCSPDPDCSALDDERLETALFAGFRDDRIVAIAPQAPAFVKAFPEGALQDLDIPTLLMSGRRDLTLPDEEQAQVYWVSLDNDNDIWLDIPDAGHQSFITTCTDLPDGQKDALVYMADDDGCGDDFTPSGDLVALMSGYLLRFADLHLRGIDDGSDWQNKPPLDIVDVKRHTDDESL